MKDEQIEMSSIKATYKGEVQFKGYSDSSRNGPCVSFRLPDREALDAFIGGEGKRFMAVLVEIMPDETPATDESPAPAPSASRQRLAPLCEWAVLRCREPKFQQWVQSMKVIEHWQTDEGHAKDYILSVCGIDSRSKLDTIAQAAALFHTKIRQPYATWLAEQGVPA